MHKESESFYMDVRKEISKASGAYDSLTDCIIDYMRHKKYYESIKDHAGTISINEIVQEAVYEKCYDDSPAFITIGRIFLILLAFIIFYKSWKKYVQYS